MVQMEPDVNSEAQLKDGNAWEVKDLTVFLRFIVGRAQSQHNGGFDSNVCPTDESFRKITLNLLKTRCEPTPSPSRISTNIRSPAFSILLSGIS